VSARLRCCANSAFPSFHALPGVGENLQDHLQARVIFRCTKPITTNDVLRSPLGKLVMGLQYVFRRAGPMAVGINQGGIFARTNPALTRPDVQFHVATLSSDMAGSKVHEFSGFTMSVCQLQPEARGYVRLKSPDPLAAPAMQPNYLSTERDRRTLVAGIRLARALAATRALAPYVAGEYRPGAEATSDEALLEFAKNTGGTIFHPSGTCKMGPARDPLAVVDHDLRRTRPRRHPRRRLQHHADARVGQHERAGGDDRGEDRRPDARRVTGQVLTVRLSVRRLVAGRPRVSRRSRPCPVATPISPPSKGAIADSPSGCRRSRSGAACSAKRESARVILASRVALFTDARLASSEYVAIVKASLAAAGVDATIYSEVSVEPTDQSLQEAARFAADGKFDGYVSVGGGSVMDTCKAANLYASQPAEFMTYVNAPIGAGQKVPGR
jgi:hypothetical protein